MLLRQGMADGDELRVDFHGHFRHFDLKARPESDLVKEENLVPGLPDSRCRLGTVHFNAIVLHQLPESVQDLADFLHHGKGNDLVGKGFLTQADGIVALFDDFDAPQAAEFHNLHADHFGAQVDNGQARIGFTFRHTNTSATEWQTSNSLTVYSSTNFLEGLFRRKASDIYHDDIQNGINSA